MGCGGKQIARMPTIPPAASNDQILQFDFRYEVDAVLAVVGLAFAFGDGGEADELVALADGEDE